VNILFAAMMLLNSCSYFVLYVFLGNQSDSPFTLKGINGAYLDSSTMKKKYRIWMECDANSIKRFGITNSNILYKETKIIIGKDYYDGSIDISHINNFYLYFINLPTNFDPWKDDHYIELMIMLKDSTVHIYRYKKR
jgi:hypothetical protein